MPSLLRQFFTTKVNGTGLGLSLARRMVESHGGTINVESKLGEGAQFTILLPVLRAQEKAS